MALTTWKCTKCGLMVQDISNVPQCPAAVNQYLPTDPNALPGQSSSQDTQQSGGHSWVPVAIS